MKKASIICLLMFMNVLVHAQINANKLDSLGKMIERQSDEFEELVPKPEINPDYRLKEAKRLSGNDYCEISEVPAHYNSGIYYNPLDYDIYYFSSRVEYSNRRAIKISEYEKKFNTSFENFYGKWKDQYNTIYTFSAPNKVKIVNNNKATRKYKRPDWGTGPDYQTGTIYLKYDNTFYYATAYGLFYIYMNKVAHNYTFSPVNLQGWCKRGLITYYENNLRLNYYFDQSYVVFLNKNEIHLKSFYDGSIFILKRLKQ